MENPSLGVTDSPGRHLEIVPLNRAPPFIKGAKYVTERQGEDGAHSENPHCSISPDTDHFSRVHTHSEF